MEMRPCLCFVIVSILNVILGAIHHCYDSSLFTLNMLCIYWTLGGRLVSNFKVSKIFRVSTSLNRFY